MASPFPFLYADISSDGRQPPLKSSAVRYKDVSGAKIDKASIIAMSFLLPVVHKMLFIELWIVDIHLPPFILVIVLLLSGGADQQRPRAILDQDAGARSSHT